ncbi:MAG: tyrosine--tRNA ligase [Clostridia bacterium]|nr:tyrosine--tRNA ligase [Clostridia bacterium]
MKIHGLNLYDFLKKRGLIYQTTDEEKVKALLNGKPITFYLGIDPTADAIHMGHLCSLRTFRFLQEAGHHGILVIGGATAQIGDPSGRSDMRTMIDKQTIDRNLENIKKLSKKFIKTDGENPAVIVSNADWMNKYSYVDFLRDVGTYFNVNVMLSAEAYKKRLANGGLTFLEMGYMPIQAFDFEHLNEKYGCVLQVGGSDQWGNMVAGVELMRKKKNISLDVMTTPLLLNSKGEKMGKTSGGALWVDEGKTSVYDFYQYFINIDDADVATVLRWFSDLSVEEINDLCAKDIRLAKKEMAFVVTSLIHGEENARIAQKTAEEIFSGKGASENMQTVAIKINQTEIGVCDLLVMSGLVASKSEARRLIAQNGIMIGDEKVSSESLMIKTSEPVILRKGKKVHIKAVFENN